MQTSDAATAHVHRQECSSWGLCLMIHWPVWIDQNFALLIQTLKCRVLIAVYYFSKCYQTLSTLLIWMPAGLKSRQTRSSNELLTNSSVAQNPAWVDRHATSACFVGPVAPVVGIFPSEQHSLHRRYQGYFWCCVEQTGSRNTGSLVIIDDHAQFNGICLKARFM